MLGDLIGWLLIQSSWLLTACLYSSAPIDWTVMGDKDFLGNWVPRLPYVNSRRNRPQRVSFIVLENYTPRFS